MIDLNNSTKISDYRDSLIAARFVQLGLLPKKKHFERIFDDSFVFYLPQNIISGDFYWTGEKHDLKYLVVGDCTGHGVSAALLSVLALNLFEYVIMNKGIKKTHKILQELDKKFIESFKDANKVDFDNPWIDLTVICLDKTNNKIHFSSANRKVLHIDKFLSPNIYKGSKYPIGGWQLEKQRLFESKTFEYSSGDTIYLGSDGFQDQFGGPKNKKFSSKRLHSFLLSIHHLPMKIQVEKLAFTFNNWKKQEEQQDDVCVVGIRL